jgi:phage protein D
MILRRAQGSPRDVILLRRAEANGAHLSAAVLHLMIVRERSGDSSAVNTTYRLPTARRGPRGWANTEQVRTQAIVARLRRTEPREVSGVGIVPATDIYLPSQAMREAARRNRSGRGL